MKVKFVDLHAMHAPLMDEFRQVFERVLENSSFILGPEVSRFEQAFAQYLGVDHAVAVSNGTVALELALLGMGVGPGDEVITVPNTFIATAEAVSAVGARPVFVDVDPVSYNMDPTLVERAITPRTRVILPVHLYGQTADMEPLLEIAARHGLKVLEDACQAHGAEYKGKKAGSMGAAGCFSFYPGKNLGALGEGGAVVTSDPELAAKMKLLRDHGSQRKYEHSVPGYNYRLEGLQGGFLAVKLPHLDSWNDRRRIVAEHYDTLLAGNGTITPVQMPYAHHVYHLYVIQADDREQLRKDLNAAGVETGLHYPGPLHLQEAYKSLGYKQGDFPVCERLAGRILSLPMFPDITREQVEFVVSVIKESQCRMEADRQAFAK
ncbi:MAG: DegT/DnrJ/EryC1/StrS family aminotransferase [Terriglobales bacterium]